MTDAQQQIRTNKQMNLISTEGQQIYFERQSRLSNLCGMHLVNNYFGYQKYTTKMMNNICYSLSQECINPHKSIFGGNYDVNVLMTIFQFEQIGLVYHDRRKDIEITGQQCGYIVNYSLSECCLLRSFDFGRHWIVFKREGEKFVQYDSLKDKPTVHNRQNLSKHLKEFNKRQSTILKMTSFSKTQPVGLTNTNI